MWNGSSARCGWHAAAALVMVAGLLAGCGPPAGPAPVINAVPRAATITIERGRTLSGIARAYHVPLHELAAANHLSPPYRILAGGVLLIPAEEGVPPVPASRAAAAPPMPVAAPPAAPPAAPASVAVAALPPLPPAPATRPPPAAPVQPAETAAPVPPPRPAAPAPPQRSEPAQRPAEARPSAAQPGAAPAPAKPAGKAAVATLPPSAHHGDLFAWPVRGRVVEGFGAGPDGTHNDGINIAAPRGAPIQAVDGGVVAYAGNELRGYGNLVLIKHPGGWISAYAHCDLIFVKSGQKVARGQVIARVGSTGNVKTPQLHFELRRGDKPLDPRTYMAPLPSAATGPARSG
jgi:murein DD-endopeptidase MepM/ murein hydrolase activator NlpD